jgi:hypothetical protein
MNKPERLHLRGAPDNVEIAHEGDAIIMRNRVDSAKVRRACASIRKHMPAAAKGESILQELNRLRIRGGEAR